MGVRFGRATVFALTCLVAIGAARAGRAGGASGNASNLLQNTCFNFGITNCPSLPTMNQIIVETAALNGVTPATIRDFLGVIPPPFTFDGGTITGTSVPLAFVATPGQQPLPADPGNPLANSFLSAMTTGLSGLIPTLDLTYDFGLRTNSFTPGQMVADLVLPFLVADASQNPVRDVTATLQLVAAGSGSAVTGNIAGDFLGAGTPQIYRTSVLGVTGSLNFAKGYVQLGVDIPLLISSDIAPAYIVSAPGYEFDKPDGLFDGFNPVAMFNDASFVDDAGNLDHAAHADLAIAIDGSTILSIAAPEPASLAVFGVGFLAIWFIWRRRAELREISELHDQPPRRGR